MKLFSRLITVLTVVAMLITCVGAAEFTISAERTEGPQVTGGDDVIITPVSEKDDPETPADTRDELNSAVDDLEDKKPGQLVEGFDNIWNDKTGAPLDNAYASDIFHVDFTSDSATFTYTLDGITEDDFVLIAKDHTTNTWYHLDYTFANGSTTVTLANPSTVVVIRDNGNPPASDITSPPTGVASVSVALAVGTVILAGAALLLTKKIRQGA